MCVRSWRGLERARTSIPTLDNHEERAAAAGFEIDAGGKLNERRVSSTWLRLDLYGYELSNASERLASGKKYDLDFHICSYIRGTTTVSRPQKRFKDVCIYNTLRAALVVLGVGAREWRWRSRLKVNHPFQPLPPVAMEDPNHCAGNANSHGLACGGKGIAMCVRYSVCMYNTCGYLH